jgi:broad specificity phosphatase PhoE
MRILVAVMLTLSMGSFVALMSQSKKELPRTYPKTVLLIRHAEKPPDTDQSIHLSDQGKKRAEALHLLFEKSKTRPEPFPKPDFLIAPKPTNKSHRSTETLEPLAAKYELTIAADFVKEDVEKLADAIFHNPKYAGKTLLIAWNHTFIPALASTLKTPNHPMNWKDEQYDRVWEIRYGTGGKLEFRDLPQGLMSGDKVK